MRISDWSSDVCSSDLGDALKVLDRKIVLTIVMALALGATADDTEIAARFPTDTIFRSIRLDPYLEATGRAHPDLAPRLADLAATTAMTKRALVHGDVSPKTILIGPAGPVLQLGRASGRERVCQYG